MAEIIEGMDALQKKLQELEYTMQRKVLIEAAKAGGQIVLDDAKSNAPRNTGKLAEGIRMQVKNGEFVRVHPTKPGTYSCSPKNVVTRKLDLATG